MVPTNMLQHATWAPVVQAALDEYLSKKSGGKPIAVPAAPLKPLLARQAERAGLSFPPEGYEHLKFADFLALFPSVVKTRRRPGQDVLVASAKDADLLDHEDEGQAQVKHERAMLRPDVFKAFTKILPHGLQPWYSKSNDGFVEGGADAADPSLVAAPPNTLDDAIADRRDFANTVTDADQRLKLLGTLAPPENALGAFSQAVKDLHLERSWHVFRLERVTQRVKDWAGSNQLEWKPGWTVSARSNALESTTANSRETNAFLAGLMQLGPDDAKRVLVPLDIVLKLIRRD